MSKFLYVLLTAAIMALSAFASRAEARCSKYCRPGVSKACGASCIPLDSDCHKSWTTACNGERPAKAKHVFATPKHVDERPEASVPGIEVSND